MASTNGTTETYSLNLAKLQGNIEYEIETFKEESDHTTEAVLLCKKRINTSFNKFLEYANEYEQILANTEQSKDILESLRTSRTAIGEAVDITLQDIGELLQRMQKAHSHISRKSGSSISRKSGSSIGGRSQATTDMIRIKAKAEAAKAALEFATKEAELKKADAEINHRRMNIQADIELLHKQKDVAVAVAEYQATIEDIGPNTHKDVESLHEIPTENSFKRTQQYVIDQSNETSGLQQEPHVSTFQDQALPAQPMFRACRPTLPTSIISSASRHANSDRMPQPTMVNVNNEHLTPSLHTQPDRDNPNNATLNEFSRFLLEKDLLMSRFSRFNDKPESYASWKSSFQTISRELQVTSVEECELLVKWLGPESSKFAHSIRISNVNNPALGLLRIWNRLQERYGSPELIETSLKSKLNNFPKITYKDLKRLYELQDILSEINSTKENPSCEKLLSYFDTSVGVSPIVNKLPLSLQAKWRDRASNYKRANGIAFPPFSFFLEFISEQARKYNDPGFVFEPDHNNSGSTREKSQPQATHRTRVQVNKTDLTSSQGQEVNLNKCLIHKTNHPLSDCRTFKSKSIEDRRKLLKENGICFKCLESRDHLSRNCPKTVTCKECNSSYHNTAMHIGTSRASNLHGGEQSGVTQIGKALHTGTVNSDQRHNTVVTTNCVEICKGKFHGKSCAKIVPVYISRQNDLSTRVKTYVIMDEQSNRSLGKGKLFDMFNVTHKPEEYTLTSCSGRTTMSGRRMSGLVIESLDGTTKVQMPTVIECDEIPDNREEIPTPDIALHHSHLQDIAQELNPLDEELDILLLVGRDLPEVHHILDQRTGSPHAPYAQRTKLGWVIVGESCLNGAHIPRDVTAMKTFIHGNGQASILEPCTSKFRVDYREVDLFRTTKDDNKLSSSVEDQCFLDLMHKDMQRNENHNWVSPLPFKPSRKTLPNNREQALNRAVSFDVSLKKDSVKRKHVLDFMQALFDNGHAERAPDIDQDSECWYLPLFGVYHPQKKDKIRIVFDSSAKFHGVSLNDVLMTGPNLLNNLVGVLLRFRSDKVAVIADVQQMFYSFFVRGDHRNYLRFVWHEDNDLSKELVDFRMKVHVFGNCPSPAIANCGLRKTADIAGETSGSDVKDYIYRNFYVDDALSSHSSSDEAIDLLKRTQVALMDIGNLRLHKICSNSVDVLSAFDKDDLAQELKELDFDQQDKDLPLQRSLGVCWNLQDDVFTYRVTTNHKPFTRRGMLSVINGLYDPLGFAAPVTLSGKLLLREVMCEQTEWDEPLADKFRVRFETWKDSLKQLETVQIPRAYVGDAQPITHRNLLIFTDASEVAVAAVAYIQSFSSGGHMEISFVAGKTKLSPKHGHTIPRLELCAAVLGVEIYETIKEELDMEFNNVLFFTDSKITLGYIYNETKRFFVYVRNRVDQIRRSTSPEQWRYVPSAQNPADSATRAIPASDLSRSLWLKGPNPSFLHHVLDLSETFPLVAPDDDCEVKTVKTSVTVGQTRFGSHRFEHFSTWSSLVRGIGTLKSMARSVLCGDSKSVSQQESQCFILRTVQEEELSEEISALKNSQPIPKNSRILNLSPYLDENGLLRVGGRLKNAKIAESEMNPIIIPRSHVGVLLIGHYHEKVFHQGQQFTENAIRKAGFWLIGSKRCVTSFIYKCVRCRKLRGKQEYQKMANLPFDRLDPAPPFSYIGLDVFGPWTIVSRRTRGGLAHSKRWALMITCLVVRAVHIEILEEMSTSCFLNAFRRFCAIRGEVKIIRSDCGTNFVGSVKDLNANVINIEDRPIKQYLRSNRINWIFNPPHASHMGGTWERMIGVARRILDALLIQVKQLTHEILVTFLAEVMSVINARPLVPISYDPDVPFPLSPSTLLTLKTDHSVRSFCMDDFNPKDIHKGQWKCIQHLANQFWHRWKTEFLPSLQSRKKWQQDHRDLHEGDIILMCDASVHRNQWPLGIIVRTHISEDNHVRKVDIRLGRDSKVFTRPIKDVILLLSKDHDNY